MSSHGEITLFDLSGWLLATATIAGLAPGGLIGLTLPEEKTAGLPIGRQVRFQCTLSTGEIRGLAEVGQVEAAQLRLRLLQIDNDEGLPRLLDAVHGWFARPR